MRILAGLLAVIAVLFLGHVLYEGIQFGLVAWLSLLLGALAAMAAGALFRRSQLSYVSPEDEPTSQSGSSSRVTVRAVSAEEVRPIRSEVLRPGQPPSALVYEHDDHPLALHAGAFLDDRLIAIGSVHPQEPPEEVRGEIPDEAFLPGASFRLRGMATLPEARGAGAGRAVLELCFEHISSADGSYLWCNARTGARIFYERMGLQTAGDEFDMPGIGPHYVMWTKVPD